MTEDEKYRDALREKQKTYIKTTMIGAINMFEKLFPELVGTEQFKKFRDGILDLGNGQIRKSYDTFENYTINRRIYSYKLPVMKRTEG